MLPKHDLRGGNVSADPFATSKTTFARSMTLCPVTAGNQWVGTAVRVGIVQDRGAVPVEFVVERPFQKGFGMAVLLSMICGTKTARRRFLARWAGVKTRTGSAVRSPLGRRK